MYQRLFAKGSPLRADMCSWNALLFNCHCSFTQILVKQLALNTKYRWGCRECHKWKFSPNDAVHLPYYFTRYLNIVTCCRVSCIAATKHRIKKIGHSCNFQPYTATQVTATELPAKHVFLISHMCQWWLMLCVSATACSKDSTQQCECAVQPLSVTTRTSLTWNGLAKHHAFLCRVNKGHSDQWSIFQNEYGA